MSFAGVRSNRGDKYQVCVAMDWAIQMIKDGRIVWMELDSTRLVAPGIPAPVDDVIVGWTTGEEICLQCKKNEPGFAVWTVEALEDDLKKAAKHLVAVPQATVRFSSRADFGDLGRLVDRARQTPDQAAFMTGFPKSLETGLNKLLVAWKDVLANGTYDFHTLLTRCHFDLTKSVDDYPSQLMIDLAQIVTRVDDAYAVLWTNLDNLGARVTANHLAVDSHRISRNEVLELLHDKGCVVAPPRVQAEIEAKLAAMSQIGRAWVRETAGRQFDRAAVGKLEAAAATKARVLLTDGPGAGKTCVALSLLEKLEARTDVATLFLQAREFADASNHDGRIVLGLEPDIPALVSALSQWTRVVVVIDSLDVLSLSRETEPLSFFLSLIDRLATIPNVCVIAVCRSFDLRFNKRLAGRSWDQTVEAGLLDWASVVAPLLADLKVDVAGVDETTRTLILNPRNLVLYADIAARQKNHNVSGPQELTDAYLDAVVEADHALGSAAIVAIEDMANEMLVKRRHQLPRSRVNADDQVLQRLCSLNVLLPNARGEIAFGHQTLLDALAVRGAIRRGLTLLQFIQALQAVPFVRPTIRAYFAHLLLGDRADFRAQIRAVFDAPDVAFHIKRLVADAYATGEPHNDDWNLVRHLFKTKIEHFRSIYDAGRQVAWHHFWMKFLVPALQTTGDLPWLEIHVQKVRQWADADPVGVFNFWAAFAASRIASGSNVRTRVGMALNGFKHLDQVDAQELLERLVKEPTSGHDFLSRPLLNWAWLDPRGDALLWRYVIMNVPSAPEFESQIESALHVDEAGFRGADGLAGRLESSTVILDLAISSMESWAFAIDFRSNSVAGPSQIRPNNKLLDETSFYLTHSRHQLRHDSPLDVLVRAVEASILVHAAANDRWWQTNSQRICLNYCGGLRYIGVLAMTRHPESNAERAKEFFADDRFPLLTDRYELGQLISAVAPYLGDAIDWVERHILGRYEELASQGRRWVEEERHGLLKTIPAMLRSKTAVDEFERLDSKLGAPDMERGIFSSSGMVGPPYGQNVFAALSDDAIVQLLIYSQGLGNGPSTTRELVGGADSVERLLHTVSSEHPRRFLKILTGKWDSLPMACKLAIFDGAGDYLRLRHGNLSASHWTPGEDVEAEELLTSLLAELERHATFWPGTREGASVVRAVAHVVSAEVDVRRLTFVAASHLVVADPRCDERLDDDLIGTAINSARGDLAQGLLVMAERQVEVGRELPELLGPTLMRLASDCHPAVRALLIRDLAFLQSKTELGWQLFETAFSGADQRVWAHAERVLYACTGKKFARAAPYLEQMARSSEDAVLKAWGRLSALFVFDNQIPFASLIEKLSARAEEAAWSGAISVWAANASNPEFAADCFEGLRLAAEQPVARATFQRKFGRLLRAEKPVVHVPLSLVRTAYAGGDSGSATPISLAPQLDEWLCEIVDINPDQALEVAEIVATVCKSHGTSPFYDPKPLGTLLTSLFREAEEREISDERAMLKRVIALQDVFLSLPSSTLDAWLQAAERPDGQ